MIAEGKFPHLRRMNSRGPHHPARRGEPLQGRDKGCAKSRYDVESKNFASGMNGQVSEPFGRAETSTVCFYPVDGRLPLPVIAIWERPWLVTQVRLMRCSAGLATATRMGISKKAASNR
jgi:hypothetical protein